MVISIALMAGRGAFRPTQFGAYLLRAFFAYGALSLIFYAVNHMPLAEAATLTFTPALLMVLLAALFLDEPIR